jgi:hypothetical protein
MKVNQELIPRRKRGGFLERMEEKMGRHRTVRKKVKNKLNLSRCRNRRENPEERRKTRTIAVKNEERRN